MRQAGCVRLYAKSLTANNNSKNQIYLGGSVESLQMFHPHSIEAVNGSHGPTFKGKLDFYWLLDSGLIVHAPAAQLILYSQYPEVRLSGILKGTKKAISPESYALVSQGAPGGVLFLGIAPNGDVFAYVVGGDSEVAREFSVADVHPTGCVLVELPLLGNESVGQHSRRLLAELRRIHHAGWIKSKQLASDGTLRGCKTQQCGGYTLEAELGIAKNGRPEADFDGWEVKSFNVRNFDRPVSAGAITLFTPEPTGGYYRTHGYQDFVRKYGYPARNGEADRLNFGGIHRVGRVQSLTGLSLSLKGFDVEQSRITDANGSIDLVSADGAVAASWNFSTVLEHWSRKHAAAAYVPNQRRERPERQYHYGHKVCLAEQGDPQRLLAALAAGVVYYDPGIKLQDASTSHASGKPRSQFRIRSRYLADIYLRLDEVDVKT